MSRKKIKAVKLKSFSFEELKTFLEDSTYGMCVNVAKTLNTTAESVYKWRKQGIPVKYWYILHFKFKMPLADLLLLDRKITGKQK